MSIKNRCFFYTRGTVLKILCWENRETEDRGGVTDLVTIEMEQVLFIDREEGEWVVAACLRPALMQPPSLHVNAQPPRRHELAHQG